MEYNLRAHSADILQPVHHFPGDEIIEQDVYESCMNGGYMSTLSFIIGGAKALKLDIDQETLERWKRICNAAYLIDDFIDNAADTRTACDLYDSSMQEVFHTTNSELLASPLAPIDADSRLLPAIILMKNSVASLPAEYILTLQQNALGISKIARLKIECPDVQHYVNLLKEEAFHTSSLITESASQNLQAQTSYSDFKVWCQQLMHMAILGDSTIDLRDDNRHEVTKVAPTVRNIAKIALHAVTAGRAIVRNRPQRQATIMSLIERSRFYRP